LEGEEYPVFNRVIVGIATARPLVGRLARSPGRPGAGETW
jgi:hypothetical protein